jgi:hypothetical protein
MRTRLDRLARHESMLSALLIGFVTLLAYLPFIHQLGFYLEDLYVIWSGVTRGPQSLIPMFAEDRPAIGYLFSIIYPLLGENPFHWHLYALALRLLMVFSLFWVLRMLWPERKLMTTTATLFYAIYPGFLQQTQALTFQVSLTVMLLATVSIGLMVYAARQKSLPIIIILYAASLALMCTYQLLVEYAIGLEVLRLLLLYVALQNREGLPRKKALLRLLIWWAPFVIISGLFVFWRFFIFNSSRPTTDADRLLLAYAGDKVGMLLRLVLETGRDFIESAFMAWVVPLYRNWYYPGYQQLLGGLLIALLAGGGCWLFIRWELHQQEAGARERRVSLSWIWIGSLSVVFGLLPVILSNRNVVFQARDARYTLPAMIGVSLLVSGLIFLIFRARFRPWVIAILIGLAVLTQYNGELMMRDDWNIQKQIWWQMSWRAPALEKATLLFLKPPSLLDFAEGYQAWAPANLIYYPESESPAVTGEILDRSFLPYLRHGIRKPKTHREIWINRNFARPLVLSMPNSSTCLHVLDGKKYELSSYEDPLVQSFAPYSRTDLIKTDVPFTTPPKAIFGSEPQHTWCYYYQKAAYARQIGDWAGIARLGDEAEQKGLKPFDPSEWMPFLEGYASSGQVQKATQLAEILKAEYTTQDFICAQLETKPDYPAGYAYETVVSVLCK